MGGIAASEKYGLNPKLPIKPIVLEFGNKFEASLVNAIDEALKDPAVKVINISMKSREDTAVKEALEKAVKKGVWIVYSAGNNGELNDTGNHLLRELSQIREIFSIGSLNYLGTPSSFSNFGFSIDFYAPGSHIDSLNVFYDPRDPDSKSHVTFNGTSMAAPVVASLLATSRAADPDLDIQSALDILRESAIARGTIKALPQINPVLAIEVIDQIKKLRTAIFIFCLPKIN